MRTDAMKERPIPFTGPMVRAILEGRKTQTRRVIKPQPYGGYEPSLNAAGLWEWCADLYPTDSAGCGPRACPYGVPGDRLWVREPCLIWRGQDGKLGFSDSGPVYADDPEYDNCRADISVLKKARLGYWQCVSPIHTPRWASRITLEVVSVRAERLQDISEADAFAEDCAGGRSQYRHLWDRINLKRGFRWATDPWVWVIEFKRMEEK